MITAQLFLVIAITIITFLGVNIIDKFVISKKATNNYSYTMVAVTIFWLESMILALFLNWTGITIIQVWKPLIAGLMSGIFYIAYFWLLRKEEVSQIIPLIYLSPIGLLIIHVLLSITTITTTQIIGILGTTLGVIILESRNTLQQFLHNKTTLLGIGYGLFLAIPIALNEAAAHEISFLNIQPIFATGVLITASLLLTRKDVRATLFQHYTLAKYSVFSEALTATGNMAFWYGLTLISAPLLSGITQITPLALFLTTTLLTRYYPNIIKEDQKRSTLLRKGTAITLIVAGTGLLLVTI